MSYPSGIQNTGRIVMSYPSGVQNTGRIVMSYPSGVQNTGRIVRSYPSGVQNTNVLRGVRALGSSFFSSVRVCTIRYESGKWHRSPSARKDELQGRARKSECPKRSVATQVFRISASAARLSAWETVALTFFCLLFLCQDKKSRWGPVGASPPPMEDEVSTIHHSIYI